MQRHMQRHMQRLTRCLGLAALIAAPYILVFPASAQTPSPSPGPSDRSANVPDQKLDATAAAMASVTKLKADYQRRLASAPESDRDRIAAEASSALKKAVTDQGLSIEEYSSILIVAQNDPEVRQKILQRIGRQGED